MLSKNETLNPESEEAAARSVISDITAISVNALDSTVIQHAEVYADGSRVRSAAQPYGDGSFSEIIAPDGSKSYGYTELVLSGDDAGRVSWLWHESDAVVHCWREMKRTGTDRSVISNPDLIAMMKPGLENAASNLPEKPGAKRSKIKLGAVIVNAPKSLFEKLAA
jgi:hypothetical protein